MSILPYFTLCLSTHLIVCLSVCLSVSLAVFLRLFLFFGSHHPAPLPFLSFPSHSTFQIGTAAFIDAEHALDPIYAKNLGVNVDDLLVCQVRTTHHVHAVQ